MFNDTIHKMYTNQEGTVGRRLLPLFIGLVLAFAINPVKAHAQIADEDEIEADIPFQFHAGDAKLPPGKYTFRLISDSNPMILEISSVDGSASALIDVEGAWARTVSANTELIFNRYGNRYFLEKLFDKDKQDGNKVFESRYEKLINQAAAEGQEHVPAHHRKQQGS
jgi:hypothetical protein